MSTRGNTHLGTSIHSPLVSDFANKVARNVPLLLFSFIVYRQVIGKNQESIGKNWVQAGTRTVEIRPAACCLGLGKLPLVVLELLYQRGTRRAIHARSPDSYSRNAFC
jgi:hypothetical protein